MERSTGHRAFSSWCSGGGRGATEGDRCAPDGIDTLNTITQAIGQAQTHGTWLILVFHRIDETGQKTSVPHELLQQIVDHLAEKNTRVVTLREALDIYGLK